MADGDVVVRALASQEIQPTFLDRMVNYLSPTHGLQRARARHQMAFAQSVMGSEGGYVINGTERQSMEGWTPYPRSADADQLPGMPTARGRSRDLSRNSPLGAGAVGTAVSGTVGTGLAVHPKLDRQALGLSDEEADAWENKAKWYFNAWAENPGCDLEEELNFYQLQELAFRSVLESGDALAVLRFQERAGHAFGTRVQLVEADRVCNPQSRPDTLSLAAGVETDRDGRTLAYHVMQGHPGDFYMLPSQFEWTRVPAQTKLGHRRSKLLYHKQRPGQRRGVVYLAPVAEHLKQATRLEHAELMGSLVSSLFTVFVKTEDDAGLSGIAPEEGGIDFGPNPKKLSMGHGLVADLGPGESIETASPNRPNAQFEAFFNSIVRQIGLGVGLPYEVLVKHFTSSYSASRAAFLMAWQFFQGRREWLASTFCQMCYEAVIEEAVLRGYLDAPGFMDDPFMRHAWTGTEWVGDSMPEVDALKSAKAVRERLEIGLTDLEYETTRSTGQDWEEVLRQRAKEHRATQAAGLEPLARSAGVEEPIEPADEEAA